MVSKVLVVNLSTVLTKRAPLYSTSCHLSLVSWYTLKYQQKYSTYSIFLWLWDLKQNIKENRWSEATNLLIQVWYAGVESRYQTSSNIKYCIKL